MFDRLVLIDEDSISIFMGNKCMTLNMSYLSNDTKVSTFIKAEKPLAYQDFFILCRLICVIKQCTKVGLCEINESLV